jgi:protein-S-isoprenylcysteine O-methyltransferase Ste14
MKTTTRRLLLDISPVIVVIVIPGLLTWWGGTMIGWNLPPPLTVLPILLGAVLCAAGAALMIWTIRLFWVEGGGSLTPMAPTQELVVSGPYRHVRNPMYTGVFSILYGEATLLGSPAILVFTVLFGLIPLIYVPLVEEPGLVKRFGESYVTYKSQVPRWIPRLHGGTGKD